MSPHTRTSSNTYTYTHINKYTRKHTHTHKHIHSQTYALTHTNKYTHKHTHTFTLCYYLFIGCRCTETVHPQRQQGGSWAGVPVLTVSINFRCIIPRETVGHRHSIAGAATGGDTGCASARGRGELSRHHGSKQCQRFMGVGRNLFQAPQAVVNGLDGQSQGALFGVDVFQSKGHCFHSEREKTATMKTGANVSLYMKHIQVQACACMCTHTHTCMHAGMCAHAHTQQTLVCTQNTHTHTHMEQTSVLHETQTHTHTHTYSLTHTHTW